ncbi:MAG: SRPBCC domain-containing protein [Flavobacteriaceae bacterium]
MKERNDLSNRMLSIKRTFKAPLKLVWEAWTQPEHIAKWWGPQGMKTTVEEHNFVVGGAWKYTMLMPDGKEFIGEGVYSEILTFQKIVTSANFRPMTEGVELQILLEETEEGTLFTFHVVHETEAYCQQQKAMGFYNGWGSTFDRLDGHLMSLTSSA